jgi:diguanylate cyclase (GGDEF)-like protein
MSSMSVFGMLVWCGAAVSLWLGARGHSSAVARGYRWLALAALGWCAGLVIQQLIGGTVSPGTGLSLADLPPLLAVAGAAVGIGVLTTAEREPAETTVPRAGPQSPDGTATLSVLPGLADGYVMAVALLVIGWVTLFSSEFHHSGDRPGTFLLALIHPLADLAVLGALLPLVTTAWRRVVLPYLSLLAVAAGDALAVGGRVSGGHLGLAAQLLAVIAAVLLGLAPWRMAEMPGSRWINRTSASAGATIIAALAASAATLVVIGYCLAGVATYGVALVIAGGAGVLVLAARVFMLVGQNGMVLRIWRESSRNLRDLANRTSDVVLICDLVGVIGYASPAAADFGYPPRDLVGRRLLDFVHPEDRLAALAAFRRALSDHAAAESAPAAGAHGGAAESSEPPPVAGRLPVRIRTADGTWRYVESTVLPYQVPGQDGQLLVTARDVSDQVALRQQVTHLTFHDGLTGLPNRAYVEERTRDALRDIAAGRRVGVIFLDLDRFTAVNDSVGHGAGDVVLAQAARRLRAAVSAQDTVSRWGSDEFAVLVESASGVQEITELAERLATAIAAEPFRVAGQQITLTASAGVAIADPAGPKDRGQGTQADGADLVLRNADVAMSRAKDAGGDQVEVYAAHMHADAVRRLEIVSGLQRAIGNGELALQYQPIVDLATTRVIGTEALVRWWRGEQGKPGKQMVPPREFLDAAEESGLIVPLGEWVLREACTQAAAWRERDRADLGVSVNLSARQLAAPGFTALVAEILAETGLPAEALTVEVNERILVEGNGHIVALLADLRRLGIRLAVDNFGTGYASLAHLRQLPLDIIKIAPSFVGGVGHDDTLTLLTRTVVQVGRDLGMRVIAEGIEQPRQLIALREMGCCYGQGFLIAGPMAASGVEALIRTADDETGGRSVSECETTPVSG